MNIHTKYQSLSPDAKKQVENFLDFLLSKQQHGETFDIDTWKKNIKNIPKWSDEELAVFEENRKLFNKWPSPKW